MTAVIRHAHSIVRLARTIVFQDIALVHIHTCSQFSFYRSLLDLGVARLLRRRAVLHIHGGQFEQFCEQSSAPRRWLIQRGCRAADVAIVLSESWRKRLAPWLPLVQLEIVANGVPAQGAVRSYVRDGDESRLCRFLYLGPLVEQKGLDDLLAAAWLLHQWGVRFEVRIAGPAAPGAHAHWARAAHAAGLESQVTLAGAADSTQRAELFAWADCLVHPSHSEGMPLTILEAAVAGLPVIATAVGSVAEILATGERQTELARYLVPSHQPRALAGAMRGLAQDADLRRRIGVMLQRHARAQFSIERQAARIEHIYECILAKRRAALRASSSAQRARVVFATPTPPRTTAAPSVVGGAPIAGAEVRA